MLHTISLEMKKRMTYLEKLDAIDRNDGTERLKRLRQIPPETGKFLAILAASAPAGNLIEVGTSAGYSTLWLSLAAKLRNQKIITMELLERKIFLAKETFRIAAVEKYVDLIEGDALKSLDAIDDISFCFLDCEKDLYFDCYKKIVPKMVPGALLICDNAINHQESLQPMMDFAYNDTRVDPILVPIGKGEFICRKN